MSDSGLVKPDGSPVKEEEIEFCPNCNSGKDKHETYNMFGGHRRTVCNKCGYALKTWRE